MISPRTIVNDAVSMCDFIFGLNANELIIMWSGVFPDISMAKDKIDVIKSMICRILERKYAMSDKESEQMLINQDA